MTKTKNNRRTTHSRPWDVRLTPEVIEYLCVPTKSDTSRLSAYLDLLSMAAETTTPFKPVYGRTFDLTEGQLVTGITDLAERWSWARETVRKFLDQMEAFRLLAKQSLDRCSPITMTMEWLDAGYTSVLPDSFPDFQMPQGLSGKMDEWLRGDIADTDLAEAIEDAAHSFDGEDPGLLPHRIAALQYSLIRQLILRWSSNKPELPLTPDGLCQDLLCRLLNISLSGNWLQWLGLLRQFSPGLKPDTGKSKASAGADSITEGRVILDSLFNHLKVDFTRNEL